MKPAKEPFVDVCTPVAVPGTPCTDASVAIACLVVAGGSDLAPIPPDGEMLVVGYECLEREQAARRAHDCAYPERIPLCG